MPVQPLTHHEILGLVEPFTRRGRHVDLAASDRLERRLAFKPIEHAGDGPAAPPLREVLVLEHLESGAFRLTRVLTLPGGLEATLQTEGPQPGELLARIEAVDPRSQVRTGDGFVLAYHHRLDAAPPARTILVRGTARVDGFTLALAVPKVRGVSGEVELASAGEDALALPEDLLAVMGWDWGRIGRLRGAWRGSVNLRRREPGRTQDAEAKLERAAAHLARTLSEPPARFHDRQLRARWEVTFRRAIPLLVCIALIAAALAVPYLGLSQDSVFRMLIFNAPPLLLALFFGLREIPRIEIPPLPRRPTASAWRQSAARGER
jgi:hypothetical protein